MAEIQLLFTDEGNSRALASLVAERHTPITADSVQQADLYLVDESAYPKHRDALEARKREVQPVFCPVVLVRRQQAPISVDLPDIETQDPPLLVNDVVQAPIGRQVLFRTITNLLARREQSETLTTNLAERTAQLEEEQKKYQTLVEQSENGIAVTQDGRFIFANERLAEILERTRETLQGTPVEDVVVPEHRDLVQRRHEQRLAGEQPPTQYEIEIVTPSGQHKHIDLRASRIEYGADAAVLVLFQDITDRKQRERELRQFKNAVEHAGHAIIVTDENGVIEYVNPEFEEMTGYSSDEAVGLTPRILKSGEHGQEFYERLWNTILDGDVWNTEIINERRSGERFIALQTIAPITGDTGDVQGFVGIQDEITERRLREQQLEVFHRVLRHNLRNKGTAIKGYASQLKAELTDQTHIDRIRTIERSIQSLLDISEKAQHFRQAIADASEAQTARNLVAFLETVVGDLETSHPSATLCLDIEPTETVSVDPRATPALEEVLENAVKHSDASPSRVTITVTADESTTTVTVSDNGPGIPEQERRALESGSERPLQHGSGLGLWLAYWLVQHTGGDIDIHADEQGTTVSVTLPRQ
jgi:PAS domain S-box-containing protein